MKAKKPIKRTLQDHTQNVPEDVIQLFDKLRSYLLKLNNIEEVVTGPYIGYKLLSQNKFPRLFLDIHIQKLKRRIVLHLRPLDYNDEQNRVFNFNYIPKWTLRKGLNIVTESDIDYAMPLVKASYRDVS